MTAEFGANDDSGNDGNTPLLSTTNPECRSSEYVYISGY